MTTNTEEEKKTNNICDNELCEILSSDESNEFIYEKNDDFIIVELISYICGNSKILSFYPCTNNNSGKNKYLYHFYKKKKIKLYLCLNTKNNEVYIYQVQRKYVENKDGNINKDGNKNDSINEIPLYSQKSDESVKIIGEIKLGNSLQNDKNYNITSLKNIEIKKENKKKSTNFEKKICITKLFDSVNCSYDISTVEYSKLENNDTKILDSLKSILEKKLKKNQKVVENNIDSQKQNKKLIEEELNYQNNNDNIFYVKKNDIIHKNSINVKSENKQDKTNVNNKEIKLLYLNFHEPAHIFMNHFFKINQDNEENSVKEITGFLKDEKYGYIEKEHLKKSKRKKYSPIFGKIKNETLPYNILENYQSDISICSTNLFFSDTEVITKENGGNCKEVKEENGEKEEDRYKKNKKKNNISFKRNNLKIKWLLLNLNLKKEEELLIQKYVMFKKTSLQKMSKELHDHDISNISTYQNKRNNLDDNNPSINIDINLNSKCNKERNIFLRYRSKSLDSYFLNDQQYCIHEYNKNNDVIKQSFKKIEKNDEKKLRRKKTISGYLSDRNEHESSYISISDSSENCKNKKDNLNINMNKQNSKECKNENNIEEERLVYMIYLDSLFPSTKGNTILEKLKKYIEHLFHRDYMKKDKRKKKNNNNILSNSGENSDSSSHTYHNNRSGNENNQPKIFFKFIYPNIIPKQNNTYDCGIYIIYFILHLCLNIHLIETDLINPFNKYVQTNYPDDKYNFNLSPQNSSKNPYARTYLNNASPWFDHKDICTKRKQMKKMLLYMKDVINWKSEKHIEILNLLFLMNCNDKNQRN
ncbi:hypothetical protein YYC_00925 [Plasmodium yoelii 17X]|uniref:Ubiquitin-like protease family profile domain-containing protein n=1 Tax=Plasmodium yoelii 17X TaxID=1323249 RepID=V7PT73_PLAYE|nr:hypothetical protein YYC_00925 [Plasmodium yoelii 17X]